MEHLLEYAPFALFVINLLLCLRIFARTEDMNNLKAELITYGMEHFITKDMYSDNHKALQDQMLQIHSDISDVKNLLISSINYNRS